MTVSRKFWTVFLPEIFTTGFGKTETQWITPKGEKLHCYLQGCKLDPSDADKGIILAAMDVSEIKRTENLVRNLSHRLMEAQENERKRIAYELHDNIAQNLSYLKINCDTFFDRYPDVEKSMITKMAKQSTIIKQTIESVRQLSYGLHPPSFEGLGLAQAITNLCDEFSEFTGLRIDFIPTGIEAVAENSLLSINLYRLVQEGLNNTRKHADAKHVKIVFVASHPNVILRIQDDGKGFHVKARKAASAGTQKMGFRSMNERVNLLGGSMKIKSQPGQGTKIFIKIPWKKE